MGPVLGPPFPHHPCPGHMNNGPWLLAPRDGRPAEGQRPMPDTPLNGRRPPLGTAFTHHARVTQPPAGRAHQRDSAGPQRPAPRAGSRRRTSARPRTPLATSHGAPPGAPPRHPTARNARSQERTQWDRCGSPVPPTPPGTHGQRALDAAPAPRDGRPEEGRCLTPDAPHNGKPAPGTATHYSRGTQLPPGHESHSAGPQRPHTRADRTWAADPDSPP